MKNLLFLTQIVLAFLIYSCTGSNSATKAVEQYNPVFKNNLAEPSNSESEDIIISLLNPSFAFEDSHNLQPNTSASSDKRYYKFQLRDVNLGVQFQQSIITDLEMTLYNRGFIPKGTFANYNDMIISDRRDSDLILETVINVYPQIINLETKSVLQPEGYKIADATAKLGGHISLILYESMTETKLWTKSVPVPDAIFSFHGEKVYVNPPERISLKVEKPFKNSMAKALEQVYPTIFQIAWDNLEPEEMLQIKQEAEQIRTEAGYDARF